MFASRTVASLGSQAAEVAPLVQAQLTAAAAIMSLSTNASVLVGSSLGGVFAAAPGPWLVYALDAAGFAVSFTMLRKLPRLPPRWEEGVADSLVFDEAGTGEAGTGGAGPDEDGGLACVAAVVGVVALLPAFRRYTAPAATPVGEPAV